MTSRVVPGIAVTIARRVSLKRLKSVDLPTFGRPTSTTEGKWRRTGRFCGSVDRLSLTLYSSYSHFEEDPASHDQGRHRQRSFENRRHHQGQGRGSGGC